MRDCTPVFLCWNASRIDGRYQAAPQWTSETRSEARCRFHASAQLDSAKISIRESLHDVLLLHLRSCIGTVPI